MYVLPHPSVSNVPFRPEFQNQHHNTFPINERSNLFSAASQDAIYTRLVALP